MRVGVVIFPGSNCDRDCFHAWRNVLGLETSYLWHRDERIPPDMAAIVLPGGFTYGDYLRVGAIARNAPIMAALREFADNGGLVIGICNGFQILTETGLLPGALLPNRDLRFLCKTVPLRVEARRKPWTDFDKTLLHIPIAHGEGNYYIDPEGLDKLERQGQIAFRYCNEQGEPNRAGNPNGSTANIAGIFNEAGNVLGMMPHPERCAEAELGNKDGLNILRSMAAALA